jgi:hypothetical protein
MVTIITTAIQITSLAEMPTQQLSVARCRTDIPVCPFSPHGNQIFSSGSP